MYTNHTNTPHTNCNNFFILRLTFHFFYFLKSPFLLLVFFFSKASMEENENSNESLGILPSPSLSTHAPWSHMTEVSRETNQNGVLGTSRVCPSHLCLTGIFFTKLRRALRITACFRVNCDVALRGFYA